MTEFKHLDTSQTQQLLNQFSPTMCLAKWSQSLIQLNNGISSSCCLTFPKPIPKISIDEGHLLHNGEGHLKERSDFLNGIKTPACSVCWAPESEGITSHRFQKSSAPWSYKKVEEIKEEGIAPHMVPGFMEISFSNVCQFSCGYCAPHVSSSIYQDIKNNGHYPTSDFFNSLDYFPSMGISYHHEDDDNLYVDAFWEWIPKNFSKLDVLKLTGGEPLLSKSSLRLFNFLSKQELHADFQFHINSNLGMKSSLFKKKMDELKEIKFPDPSSLTLITSLDGMGPFTEYLRYGLDLNQLKENLECFIQMFPLAQIRITPTLNIASAKEMRALYEYSLELKLRQQYEDQYLVTCYALQSPSFLSLKLLTKEEIRELEDVLVWMNSKECQDYKLWFKKVEIDHLETALAYSRKEMPETEYNQLSADLIDFLKDSLLRKPPRSSNQLSAVTEFIKSRGDIWFTHVNSCLTSNDLNSLKEILRLIPKLEGELRERAHAWLLQEVPKLANHGSYTLIEVLHKNIGAYSMQDLLGYFSKNGLHAIVRNGLVTTLEADACILEHLKSSQALKDNTSSEIYEALKTTFNRLPKTWAYCVEQAAMKNEVSAAVSLFTVTPLEINKHQFFTELIGPEREANLPEGFQEKLLIWMIANHAVSLKDHQDRLIKLQSTFLKTRFHFLIYLIAIKDKDLTFLDLKKIDLPMPVINFLDNLFHGKVDPAELAKFNLPVEINRKLLNR